MAQEFKQYTGTKTIMAAPMTKTEAEKVLGKSITPATPDENGYLVEYPDGYRSWSPASVFEAAYRVSETHVDRMKIELEELNERICKATSALYMRDSSLQANCALEPLWNSLREQVNIMMAYADLLTNRIRQVVGYEVKISGKKEAE